MSFYGFFALYLKDLQTTHTLNFPQHLVADMNILVYTLTQHFWDTQYKDD